ncbi:cytochrome P450 [Arthrobacter sp. B6]|uniref:cytochrome P450 n=1 Tax=Arthrobacter sp. B6 TaxID=1570137 RepID=UPI0008365EB9|nr:cytochrome P450 [Arthrobacter sp. B6]
MTIDYPIARDARCPYEPPAAYLDTLLTKPITKARLWNGDQAWLIVGHKESNEVLADDRFSARPDVPGYPHVSPALAGYRKSGLETFNNKDNPQHSLERRMFTKWFTVRRINSLHEKIADLVDRVLDGLIAEGDTADLYAQLALPIPSQVIFAMLNAPYEDHLVVEEATNTILSWRSTTEESAAASAVLLQFCESLVKQRKEHPLDDDVISEAIEEHVNTGQCTLEQLTQGIRLLFLAGHETTANAISMSILVLLDHPHLAAQLRESEDPAFVERAVKELLRFVTIAQAGRCRVALQDVTIGGVTIKAGEGVIVSSESANRDPSVFEHASEVDFDREHLQESASFGYGTHRCVGERLAVVELQVVLPAVLRKLPDLRLTVERKDLPYKTDHTVFGVYELPVAWG